MRLFDLNHGDDGDRVYVDDHREERELWMVEAFQKVAANCAESTR